MRSRLIPLLLAGLILAGCGRKEQPPPASPRAEQTAPQPNTIDTRQRIVAFGDSLTAGQGAGPGHSYPDYLQAELDRLGYPYRVVNAGVSGDTTNGGRVRVADVAALKPAIVILELGANDGLRGLPVVSTRANLEQIILVLQEAGAEVVLAGMTLPPNYGRDYIRSFEGIYTALAAKHRLRLIPFLLEGVAGTARYMQEDGLHPTAEGNRLVALTVLRSLEPTLSAPPR